MPASAMPAAAMPAAAAHAASSPDLSDLLAHARALDDALVAEARRRPASEVLAAAEALLLSGLKRPGEDRAAVRAVHLAAELRLPGAAAMLCRSLARLPDGGRLRSAVLSGLARLGPDALDDLVAAYDASRRSWERGELAEVLASIPGDDPRIRAVLLRRAAEEPDQAATHLARRGDWRAAPGLLQVLEAHLRHPAGDCLCCVHLGLGTVAEAVRALGGTVEARHDAAIDGLIDRPDFRWIEGGEEDEEEAEETTVPLQAVRRERPGRNDPCWCGSGKKYKRCHLDEDQKGVTH